MLARDLRPSRLQALKRVAVDFVRRRPNDRIGIVVYAGESFTKTPVTSDKDIIVRSILEINYGEIEDGTAIGMGLGASVNRLKNSRAKSKVIILLTDGVNNTGFIDPNTATQLAKDLGIKVYTIAIGTNGMAAFPYAKDSNGKLLFRKQRVEIDEKLLEEIANQTGGFYFRATDNQKLQEIYNEIDQLETSKIEEFKYYNYRGYLRKKHLQKKINKDLLAQLAPNYSAFKPLLKISFLLLGFAFLVVALANPKMGFKLQTVKKKGVNVVFALDVSRSMLAQDIAPNRLEKAKQIISKTIENLGSDRVGLIVYAGTAYPLLPITTDHAAAQMFLNEANPEMVSSQGTAIDEAIKLSTKYFDDATANRFLVLLSDGEDHGRASTQAFAKILKEQKIKLFTIGIGTQKGGPIPMEKNGATVYKKDRKGTVVITHRNDETLQKICAATGGKHLEGNITKNAVTTLSKTIANAQKNIFETKQFSDYKDQYGWFVGLALLFFLLEMMMFSGKTKWIQKLNLFKGKNVAIWLVFCTLCSHFVSAQTAQPTPEKIKTSPSKMRKARKFIREGNALYQQKKYEDAAVAYQKALDAVPNYRKALSNLASTRYQQKLLPQAMAGYQQSLKTAEKPIEKADDFHNLGNSLLAQKQYEKAVAFYKKSLINRPTDEETRYNLAYAQSMIKKKKNKGGGGGKNKKNQKKNQKKKGQNKKKNQKKNQKKNPQKNKQDQSKNKQQKQPPPKRKLTPQQRKRLLQALKNQERNTRKKVKAQKAKKKGSFVIEPATIKFKGKSVKSNPIKIEVLPASALPQDPDDPYYKASKAVFMKTRISKQKPYVGEGIYVEYVLYFRYPISNYNLQKMPKYVGFWNQQIAIKDIKVTQAEYNGEQYNTAVMAKSILVPQRAGRLEVDPMSFDVVVGIGTGQYDWFGNPVTKNVSLQVESKKRFVLVNELPLQGKPSDFNGAVGDFKLRLKTDANTVKTYESLQVKVTVSGVGNLGQIAMPKLQVPPSLELYKPERKENFKISRGVLLFPLTVLVARIVGLRKKDTPQNRSKNADALARKYLNTARKKINEKGAFYEALEKGLYNYIKAKLRVDIADINKENIQEMFEKKGVSKTLTDDFIALLAACDLARYTPVNEEATAKHYDTAKDLIAKLNGYF
uniref:Uncharacterized protein BB-0173 n=1 Tax=Stylophora pistillata TaxID=50429 RepID=A0A2B4R4F9_STYPI